MRTFGSCSTSSLKSDIIALVIQVWEGLEDPCDADQKSEPDALYMYLSRVLDYVVQICPVHASNAVQEPQADKPPQRG